MQKLARYVNKHASENKQKDIRFLQNEWKELDKENNEDQNGDIFSNTFQAVFKRTVTIEETVEVDFEAHQNHESSSTRGQRSLNDFSSLSSK